jgi:hypothetical chaperone protein
MASASADRLDVAVRDSAENAGAREVYLIQEPMAAAIGVGLPVDQPSGTMVIDIGGGTSDFSILRLSPTRARAVDRSSDILATGGVRVGGTDFDRALSLDMVMPTLGYKATTKGGAGLMPNHYFLDLATWHKINALYVPRVAADIKAMRHEIDRPELLDRFGRVIAEKSGHALAMRVEATKIAISDAEAARIVLTDLTGGPNPMATQSAFSGSAAPLLSKIKATMLDTLSRAGVAPLGIGTVFLTGGAAHMPALRALVEDVFDSGHITTGDMLGSVGAGLAHEAQRRFG